MSQILLKNAKVVLQRKVLRGGVIVRDGQVAQVFLENETPSGFGHADTIDVAGDYLAPGLIDIHIHGSAGIDLMETDESGIARLSEFLLAEGVTGYFATLVPTDDLGYRSALASIKRYLERPELSANGARVLGVHFEGPFVNKDRCGALQPQHFRTYDGDHRSIDLFNTAGALMTVAPEIEGGVQLVRDLTTAGVRAFIGHSQADPEILDKAADAGARHITHFPNALDPLHHRKPGAVCWGLVRSDVTVDCIADFHHVHPLMLELILQSKGATRTALISDAIPPTGLGNGEFRIWGETISVRDGKTSLATESGEATIAGSVITLRQAMSNFVSLGASMSDAVHMASLVPAGAAGIGSRYGSIEEGKLADLVCFDDELAVRFVMLGGSLALAVC